MKNLMLIAFLIGVLFSCTKSDKLEPEQYREFDIKQYPQTWQLVKMYGQIPNSETEGDKMEWQESYILNSDGTFTKSREYDGKKTSASGTFVFKEQKPDGTFVELTFEKTNSLIGSCYSSSLKEILWMKSDNYIVGTWSYCDGPGLEYRRVQ